jgi:RNA polymerase sigma factor (sigma-70 family)
MEYKELSIPNMATVTESSLLTRRSLISRLRDLDDAESWRVFFDTYWELIYNVARQSGLDDSAAQDVVQDTVIGVARRMPEFRYDPAKGSFKHWLLRIAHRRIVDHLRRLYRQPPRAEHGPDVLDDAEPDSVSDPASEKIQAAWEEEWERRVLAAAIEQVKREVNPKHFQIFDYAVLKEWPVARVTETLRINAAQVYLARHRVARAVKQRANILREEFLRGDHGQPIP